MPINIDDEAGWQPQRPAQSWRGTVFADDEIIFPVTVIPILARAVLLGSGSPQNVVIGDPGQLYSDSSGFGIWQKQSGTGTAGWVKIV